MSVQGRPKLLLLGSQMAVGGAQQLLLAQAKWFRENGYYVVAAFFYDREGVQLQWHSRHAIEIVDLRAWRDEASIVSNLPRLLGGMYRLFRLVRREHIDVIETFTHHANLLGSTVAWLARVPRRVGTHHGRPAMGPGLGWLHSLLVNTGVMTNLVVVAEHLREEAISVEGVRPERVIMIANGVDGRGRDSMLQSAAQMIRAELEVPAMGRLVLSVGRLVADKSHIHLIEAVPGVLERHGNTKFAIAGDGPLRDMLQRRVRELGLEESVLLLGTRADVPSLLAAAHLFAYPSIRDGLPLVLLEALSMRVPIVANASAASEGFLQHGKNALLVAADDPEAFADSLSAVLDSSELRQKLTHAGAELVAREFSLRAMCQHYDKVFRYGSLVSG